MCPYRTGDVSTVLTKKQLTHTTMTKDKALLYKVKNTWALECLWPRQLIKHFNSAKDARNWANERHFAVIRVEECDS